MKFGRFGREDSALVMITISGGLTVKIRPLDANEFSYSNNAKITSSKSYSNNDKITFPKSYSINFR